MRDDAWHHVVLVQSRSDDGAFLYLDGALEVCARARGDGARAPIRA